MKLSNVLLTAMLTSAYAGQAQDSIMADVDSLNLSSTQNNSVEISIDSVLLKKIDSIYANRNKKKHKKQFKQKTPVLKEIRPYFNCPGCGRG